MNSQPVNWCVCLSCPLKRILLWSRKNKFWCGYIHNKCFFDRVSSIKMAGYWPCGFVCLFCHCCLFVLLFCVCFFFSIFTDLNFVLGHKTQIQLAFMTRGIKGLFVYLFIYWFICNKITTIQPVFENGWLQSSNYTKKKEKKIVYLSFQLCDTSLRYSR